MHDENGRARIDAFLNEHSVSEDDAKWQDLNALRAEACDTFTKLVAEDCNLDASFNVAIDELFTQLRLTRALADERGNDNAELDAQLAFSAELIANAVDDIVRTKDLLAHYRADLSRASGRLSLMLAPMFPDTGILASLLVSHDSAIARIEHLVSCEAALRGMVRAIDAQTATGNALLDGMLFREALDSSRELVSVSDSE